ncbi:MAG TPA: flagellar filament capping protein FliD, partial [Rhodocyclaceae bacterium]|nr:flagellar filament capping protein FliD [Rhodocyclaceae bacterium]
TYTGGVGGSFALNDKKSTQTITIPAGQNTLSGVRDAINSAGAGVTASIVNDGTGYRLLISSNDTGAANAMRIQTTGSLGALAYDATAALPTSMTQTQTAIDAQFSLDGISITKSSNTVTDALDGVTFTLLKSNSGSPTTLSVSRDTSTIATMITNFVSAYNTMKTSLNNLTSYDDKTKVAGTLQGDATTLSIESQLRGIFNGALSNAGGGYTTLSDVGISFKKDGTLTLDTGKMNTALADSTKDIASLFGTVGKPTDSLITYSKALDTTKPGNYAVNVTQIATQGKLTGNAALAGTTTITTGSNDALTLTVDGKSVSVTLTAGSYTPATLAAEIQSKVNGALGASGSTVSVGSGTAASVSGGVDISALTFPFAPASGNDTFNVTIDGTTKTISLSGGSYADATEMGEALGAAINAQFGDGTVDVSIEDGTALRLTARGASAISVAADGSSTLAADLFGTTTTSTGSELTVTSNAYGANSNITITGGTAAASLFGTIATGSIAVNVAGTINGEAATGFGQKLTSTTGDSAGMVISVIGGSTGSRGTIKFDHGFAVKLTNAIDAMTDTSGIITSRTDGLNKSIDDLGDQSEKLAARLVSIEARYRAQFNALDAMIAGLQQTSTFLDQQLSALSGSSSSKK